VIKSLLINNAAYMQKYHTCIYIKFNRHPGGLVWLSLIAAVRVCCVCVSASLLELDPSMTTSSELERCYECWTAEWLMLETDCSSIALHKFGIVNIMEYNVLSYHQEMCLTGDCCVCCVCACQYLLQMFMKTISM